MTTAKASNIFEPAPRWFRLLKKILYTLTGSSIVSGTLQRFGVSDADCLLIMGWLILIGELLGSILANGETYANAEKKPIIIEVNILPLTKTEGVDFYFYNGNYYYWDNATSSYKDGGATLPTKGF